MKCPLCGYEFKRSESESACKGCPLAMSCSLVRCPNCGYETLVEPKLIKILKKWRSNANESE